MRSDIKHALFSVKGISLFPVEETECIFPVEIEGCESALFLV